MASLTLTLTLTLALTEATLSARFFELKLLLAAAGLLVVGGVDAALCALAGALSGGTGA